MKILILLLLSPILWSQELPTNVFIETKTMATTVKHYYAIHKDRLWFKANPDSNPTGNPQDWTIFYRNGIPFDKETYQPLTNGKKLKEVYADGDIIITLDSEHKIYIYQTSNSAKPLKVPYRWKDTWGAPFADELFIPQNIKSMTITRRSANTIEYMEDRIGNKIKGGGEGPLNDDGEGTYGGLIHIFLLSQDGTEINYADTGLPPGFGYRYATPFRGRFVAESISGSGSIVFLIGKSGRIFSRPLDFDMNGNNPMMYDYTYWPTPNSEYDGDNEDRFAYVNLPAIPWYEESQIPIWEKRALTKNITMISTGHGNAARELRVQGRNEDGKYGYFFKKIFTQDEWQFRITHKIFDTSEIMISIDKNPDFALGPKKDLNFPGTMKIKKLFSKKEYEAEVLNYNLVDSPARIKITLKGLEQFEILLHTIDMWTMQTIEDPGRDGTPKLSLGTIEIPINVLGTNNQNIRRFLDKYLLKAHLAEFRFTIMASKNYLAIESRDKNLPLQWYFSNNHTEIPDYKAINGYLTSVKQSQSKEENIKLLTKYVALRDKIKKQLLIQNLTNIGIQIVEKLPIIGWMGNKGLFTAAKKMFRWGPIVIHSRIEILKKQVNDLNQAIELIEQKN